MKILLLEDDIILSEIIEEYLCELECEVVSVYNGEEAQKVAYEEKFDLLLLDVNVPEIDGFTFLRSLRSVQNNTPAIFITSLDSAKDVENGFICGGDDYLKKPFDLLELKVRIDNLKKRFGIEQSRIVKIDDRKSYDYCDRSIVEEENRFHLSKKEAEILEYFLKNPHRVLSFEEILNNVWSYEDTPTHATLRTYIKNLRKRLANDSITNIKGIGYRFH